MSDNGRSRRQYLTTIGGTAVTLSVAGCASDTGSDGGAETQAVTAGTAPGFPPFEMKEDGELVGFDVTCLRRLSVRPTTRCLGGRSSSLIHLFRR